MSILFAIDPSTEATIVSASQKGSNKIDFIERINRNDNEVLFNAVVTLTCITNAANFDIKIFPNPTLGNTNVILNNLEGKNIKVIMHSRKKPVCNPTLAYFQPCWIHLSCLY